MTWLAITAQILRGYTLPIWGYHGVVHWARVMENGLRVAETNGADREVVALFALFHDSRRVNESRDDGHGLRGGELAHSLRGTLIHLDDARFDLLFHACRLHPDGFTDDGDSQYWTLLTITGTEEAGLVQQPDFLTEDTLNRLGSGRRCLQRDYQKGAAPHIYWVTGFRVEPHH